MIARRPEVYTASRGSDCRVALRKRREGVTMGRGTTGKDARAPLQGDPVQTEIERSFVNCQKVPPGGHAIEGPLKVPFEEKTPPAPSEGVVWALKNQLK